PPPQLYTLSSTTLFRSPAALAGVLDVRRDVLELRAVLLERGVEQLEQPRAHDRPVAPDPGDLVQVEVELGVLHDLEALRVRLHRSEEHTSELQSPYDLV